MPPDNFPAAAKKRVKEAWRNYCLYERWLDSEPSSALVLLFYSSVHLVQAHAVSLCATNKSIGLPADHSERRQFIADRLMRIVADYRELQTASENVRYEMVRYSRDKAQAFYEEEFARILEDMHKKGVSWDTRLTKEERDTIV